MASLHPLVPVSWLFRGRFFSWSTLLVRCAKSTWGGLWHHLNPHQPDVWESLISPGGGQMAHRGKLAVWAMFLHSKQQKSYQGTLGTLELTPIGSGTSHGPSMDPTGSLAWTLWFSRIFQAVYTFSIFYTPLNMLKHFLVKWKCTRAQWTLLDLHGPKTFCFCWYVRGGSPGPW